MKIFHTAIYGPSKSGIHEAARDMIKADILAGHEVYFIDIGNINSEGIREYQPIGTVDNRGGFKLITSNPRDIEQADIIIDHNGMPQEFLDNNKEAPVIFIVHGRPVDSFRIEQQSTKGETSYSYMAKISQRPRVKKMVYFWPEFKSFWDVCFSEEKSIALNYPVMDNNRFNPIGEKYIIKDENRGEYNILICDSWGRKDIDMFEIINGVIQTGREIKNFKLHFYGVENGSDGFIQPCWELLIKEMRKLGIMGQIYGRTFEMEKVYRAMDVVLTPHKIITRVVGEALLSGVPVIASNGCTVSQFHCDPHDPYSVSKAIIEFINSDQVQNKKNALEQSKKLSLENYSKEMNKIYKEIIKINSLFAKNTVKNTNNFKKFINNKKR